MKTKLVGTNYNGSCKFKWPYGNVVFKEYCQKVLKDSFHLVQHKCIVISVVRVVILCFSFTNLYFPVTLSQTWIYCQKQSRFPPIYAIPVRYQVAIHDLFRAALRLINELNVFCKRNQMPGFRVKRFCHKMQIELPAPSMEVLWENSSKQNVSFLPEICGEGTPSRVRT